MPLLGVKLLVALALICSTARADGVELPDNAGPIPDDTLRFDIGLGVDVGVLEAGPAGDAAFGGDARVGLHYDRFSLLARGRVLSLSQPDSKRDAPSDGYEARVGGDLRYSFSQAKEITTSKSGRPTQLVRGDWWIGAGLGYEHLSWAQGVGEERPDFDVGFGHAQLIRWGSAQQSHALISLELELDVARSPTSRVDPTPTNTHDHSVLFSMSIALGN